jgi:hypothetical protein
VTQQEDKLFNDIGRNSLLGNGKKIAKFLMRTFTCRSTFRYGWTAWRIGVWDLVAMYEIFFL